MNLRTDILYTAVIAIILFSSKLAGALDGSWLHVSLSVLVYPTMMAAVYVLRYGLNKARHDQS